MFDRRALIRPIPPQALQGRSRANLDQDRNTGSGWLHGLYTHQTFTHQRSDHIAQAVVSLPVQAQVVRRERRFRFKIGETLELASERHPQAELPELLRRYEASGK